MKTLIAKHFSSLNINRTSDVREENISAVIYTLLTNKNISRKQIVNITGLASSTVSGITDLLFEKKLIKRIGNLGENSVGRRSEILARNPNAACVATVFLTPERCQISIVDFAYEFIERKDIDFEEGFKESQTKLLIREVKEIIKMTKSDKKLLAIALALPHHPFNNDFIVKEFRRAFSEIVLDINNVEAMAMYHYYELFSKELHTLVYVYIGTGIGSGIIINGSLYKGISGYASDLGHMYVTDKPLICRCGRKGCLETVSSEVALSNAFLEHFNLKKPMSRDELIDFTLHGIERNDVFVITKLKEAIFYLSKALFNIVTILDPQEIIITGRINRLNPYFSSLLEKEYIENSMQGQKPGQSKPVPLRFLPLKEDAGLKGAAMYSYLNLFCDTQQRRFIWKNKNQFS